jgi:hypothetical protein
MTRVEIINDTVAYYSEDTSRRGLSPNGESCEYLTGEGKMCAVGRCLLPSARKKVEAWVGAVEIAKNLGKRDLDSVLSKKYTGHAEKFWAELQVLHDRSVYWDDKGITKEGELRVGGLLLKWA